MLEEEGREGNGVNNVVVVVGIIVEEEPTLHKSNTYANENAQKAENCSVIHKSSGFTYFL